MKKLITATFALLMSLSMMSELQAQVVRNGVERSQDRNQIANGKATIERDAAELKQFASYQQGLDAALGNGNFKNAKAFQMKLVNAMEREIQQGQAKINQSKREVNQSRSELNSSRREVRNTRGTGRPVATADDRGDKRDDRRDLNDDKNDRNEQIARNNRQKEILGTFRAIQINGAKDLASIRAKRGLLEEFEQTMRRDMNENREELMEDKGELREDRRETREDRRQRGRGVGR